MGQGAFDARAVAVVSPSLTVTVTSDGPGPLNQVTSDAPWRWARKTAAARPPSSDASAAASAAVCARVRSTAVRPIEPSARTIATSSTALTVITRTAACPRSFDGLRPSHLVRDAVCCWLDMIRLNSLGRSRVVISADGRCRRVNRVGREWTPVGVEVRRPRFRLRRPESVRPTRRRHRHPCSSLEHRWRLGLARRCRSLASG